jgi:hypothetical protein
MRGPAAVDLTLEQLERQIQLSQGDPPQALGGALRGQQRELAQSLALCAQAPVALGLRQSRSRAYERRGGERRRDGCRQRRDN